MQALSWLMLVVAGAALIAQTLIMASASTQVSTLLIPLLLNFAIGLSLPLLLLLWRRRGPQP
jgi:transporter family-2 protein